jgi:hypothetical protein
MTWQLRKPNVTLNVRPVREWDARRKDASIPRAGLSDEARALHRKRRERECRKIPLTATGNLVTGSIKARPTF